MNKYTLGTLQNDIDTAISLRELNVVVNPAEPPMIEVIKGKHKSFQKLGKFLKANTIWVDSEIKLAVEQYKEINSDLSSYKVKYSTEYVEVYKTPLYAIDSTSKSCMTGEDCVRVYGYDERLELLTIHKDSQLIGRTLVRNDNQTYVRIYIDHNKIKSHVAHALVEKEGYTKGNLLGIELEKIEGKFGMVAPYLDGNYQGLMDNGESFVIVDDCNGDYLANNTNGYAEEKNQYTCEICGCGVEEDEMCCVNDSILCEECLNDNYTYIESVGDYVSNDDVVYCESDDEYHVKDDSNIYYVNSEDKYYLLDDVVFVDDECELLENCVRLETEHNDNEYVLESDAIKVDDAEDFYRYLTTGWYHTEQLEEMVECIEELLENDLYTDIEHNLKTELEYITNLL